MSQQSNNIFSNTLGKFILPAIRDTEASSGKKETRTNLCRAEIENLQELLRLANKAYDHFNEQVSKEKRALTESGMNLITDIVLNKIQAGENAAMKLMSEIEKVTDPYKISYVKMIYSKAMMIDYAIINSIFEQFEKNLLTIEKHAKDIKENAKESVQEVTNASGNTYNQTNKSQTSVNKPKMEMLAFQQILYDFDMYMILPDNTKVNFEKYITEFLYSMDFDSSAMPIYSISMKFPADVYNQIRNHFENIKWFFNLRRIKKTADPTSNAFTVPDIIKDNEELLAIDPQFAPASEEKGRPEGSLPLYPLKLDFISARDFKLNSKVQAKVFNKVKLIDVIALLCSNLREEFRKKGIDTKDDVKFSISPPDNNTIFEQIIVNPGSFTSTIYDLQKRYGIYQTGVSITFDSTHFTKDESTGKIISEKFITICEKGGTAPGKGSLSNAVVELVDSKNTENISYTSGYVINAETSTMTIRSNDPYTIIKKNSERLSKGETIRVMSSSPDSHSNSVCDTPTDITDPTQKFYWSKYDNPYALTQLQDSVREKNLSVMATVRDVDVLSLNNNLNYFVKFYSVDDETASGRYRLSKSAFYFVNGKAENKGRVEVEGTLFFTNLPELRVNGSVAPRKTYSEKLGNAAKQNNSSQSTNIQGSKAGSSTPGYNPSSPATARNKDPFDTAPSAPFKTNFAKRKDFYGKEIPNEIDLSYEMSPNFKFQEICVDNGSFNPYFGKALAENFDLFINAQRFCKEVLERIGKGNVGKIMDLFRIDFDPSEVEGNRHILALACDFKPASGDGLVKPFINIATSVSYNNCILHSLNGSGWDYIHIDYILNEENKKRVIVSSSRVKGDYKEVFDIKSFAGEPDKLNYSEHRKYL